MSDSGAASRGESGYYRGLTLGISCEAPSEPGFASFIPLFGGSDFLAALEREVGKMAPGSRSLAKGAHMGLVFASEVWPRLPG